MDEPTPDSSTSTNVQKTIFAVKLIDNEFVVEYSETVAAGVSDNEQLNEYLQNFRVVLGKMKEKTYDRDLVSQLMEAQTKLIIYEPKRRIEELRKALIPLQHQLEAYEFSLGLDGAVETSNQPATQQGNSILLTTNVLL